MAEFTDAVGQDIEEGSAVVFAHYTRHIRMDGVGYPMKLGRVEEIGANRKQQGLDAEPLLVVAGIGYDQTVRLNPSEVVVVPMELFTMAALLYTPGKTESLFQHRFATVWQAVLSRKVKH